MSKQILFACILLLFSQNVWAAEEKTKITVYKSPYCGCCSNWMANLEKNGFHVKGKTIEDMRRYKDLKRIPEHLRSCHTARVGGYVIEGHVPTSDIRRLLKERPEIRGLALPGMPVGSPGMEQGSKKEAFNVIGIRKDGSTFVFSRHRGN